ncbi:ferric reductase-like transmembrane domain-containing protein [Algirhabdus cladophorae]|uniref:ferric reductase-like transmembrane domain-containing protein n=1 Tax=Algirhabdus cladophorae TaxID=3377108 RepID=UPI003B845C56
MSSRLIWALIVILVGGPVLLALANPLLAYRDWIYIGAGFAGIFGLGLLLVQPLLAARLLPNLTPFVTRQAHRAVGAILLILVGVHVGGLWITSPPDVIDALLLRSPTPFAIWGVIALWALVGAAVLAILRRKLAWRLRLWRLCHFGLGAACILGTVAHALWIEGAMEPISKAILCAAVVLAGLWAARKALI